MYSLVTCNKKTISCQLKKIFFCQDKDFGLNEPSDLIIMTKDMDLYLFWQDVSWDPVGTLHEYWLPVYLEEERETLQQKIQIFPLALLENFSMSNVLMFWLPSSHPCQLPAALEQVPQSYKCWKKTKQRVWQVSPKSNFFGDSVSVWVYRHSKIVKMLSSSPVGPPEINWRIWSPQGTRF